MKHNIKFFKRIKNKCAKYSYIILCPIFILSKRLHFQLQDTVTQLVIIFKCTVYRAAVLKKKKNTSESKTYLGREQSNTDINISLVIFH